LRLLQFSQTSPHCFGSSYSPSHGNLMSTTTIELVCSREERNLPSLKRFRRAIPSGFLCIPSTHSQSMLRPTSARLFTSTTRSLAGTTSAVDARAIVFTEHGDPNQVLKAHRYRLPKLEKGQVRLRFELGAISKYLKLSTFLWKLTGFHHFQPQIRLISYGSPRFPVAQMHAD